MDEPPPAIRPPGDGRCLFRRRTAEEDAPAGEPALERELARGRRLEDEVLAVQDQERARLASVLHDGVSQTLVGVSLLLEMHLRQLQESGPDAGAVQSGLKLRELLDRTIQEMRALSHGLHGMETSARDGNLRAALHAMAGSAQRRRDRALRGGLSRRSGPGRRPGRAPLPHRAGSGRPRGAPRRGGTHRDRPRTGAGPMAAHHQGRRRRPGEKRDAGAATVAWRRSMEYRAAVLGGTLTVRRAGVAGDRPGTVVACTFP